MAAPAQLDVVVRDLTGGRNGYDSPLEIPDDQCAEALNVDFFGSQCGTKRNGATAVSVSFSAGGPFAGSIGSLLRHVPGDDETAAELWAIDGNATNLFARMAGATTFAAVTMKDNLSTAIDANNVIGASLNGFLWLCFKAAGGINRLHVWDPSLSKVRRVGIAIPNAPTALADGGTGLSFTRYYRVRDVDISGASTRRRSEASSVIGPVTIANLSGVTVTKGAATNEDETHWELEASDTGVAPWYRIAQTVIGTTSFDDTNATIPTTTLSPTDGINVPPPGAKFIIATDARLVMANAWDTSGGFTTPKNTRVWFTPVIGDNDVGDLERIPVGNYLDVDAAITGLAGGLQGSIYVFSYRRCWKLVPTGDVTQPYAKYTISTSVGCIRHQSIVAAEDAAGNPCIYFLSHRGPYRVGSNGLEYCGADVIDLWGAVNLGGTNFGVYHGDKHQVWWYLATTANQFSDRKIVLDVRRARPDMEGVRRGWSFHLGDSCGAYAAVMFSTTLGASMSRDLKPYIAQSGGTGRLWLTDDGSTGTATDNGTTYPSYVTTKEYAPAGLRRNLNIGEPSLIYTSGPRTNGVLSFSFGFDFFFSSFGGVGTVSTATVAWNIALARLKQKVEGLMFRGAGSFAVRLGDKDQGFPTNSLWQIDAFVVPVEENEPR